MPVVGSDGVFMSEVLAGSVRHGYCLDHVLDMACRRRVPCIALRNSSFKCKGGVLQMLCQEAKLIRSCKDYT